MKLFKKFLLAAATVGLVGSLGFASKAMAAPETLVFDSTGDILKVASTTSGNQIVVKVGDVEIFSDSSKKVSQNSVDIKAAAISKADKINDSFDKVTVTVKDTNNPSWEGAQGTYEAFSKLYKVTANPTSSKGTAKISQSTTTGQHDYFGHKDDTFTLVATPSDSTKYSFSTWNKNGVPMVGSTATMSNVKVEDGSNIWTATFDDVTTPTEYGKATLKITYNGKTYSSTEYADIIIKKGETITVTASKPKGSTGTMTIDVDQDEAYLKQTSKTQSSITYTANKESGNDDYATLTVVASDDADFEDSDPIAVYVIGESTTVTPRIDTTDYVEYITNGYTLEFKAKAVNVSIPLSYIKFAVKEDSSYKDYVEKIEYTENTSDGNVTVKVKFKDKLDKGTNDKLIKLVATAYIDNAWKSATIDSATATEKDVTIYSVPTLSYSDENRTLTYKAPKKVNTGNESGVDDNNKDSTKTAISDIKGVKLQVLKDSESLGTTSVAKEKGTGATIDASTVESIITNLSSKFSGDSVSITFRAFPCDSSAVYNKRVYADSSTNVYRVVITYTKADGTTAEEVVYGLKNQEIDVTKIANLKNATVQDSDGKTVTKIKVSDSTANNRYTAVLGASKAAADGEGLDKVPKTGQSNAMVFVMVAIVACAVCAGLYFYNKKAKNL